MFKGDVKVKELTRVIIYLHKITQHHIITFLKGYFIGETLFVRSNMKYMLGFGATAVTDVEVIEVNLPFVKQLLSVDKVKKKKINNV